jgi:hypothetical protein
LSSGQLRDEKVIKVAFVTGNEHLQRRTMLAVKRWWDRLPIWNGNFR